MIKQDELVEFLNKGATAEELDSWLRERESPEVASNADRLYLSRISWIGGLRSQGFTIPRQRGYYKITGFESKKDLKPADQWPEEQRTILEHFESLPKVTPDDYLKIQDRCRSLLVTGDGHPHQLSAGYTLSYELANDEGRWSSDGSIIVKKFSTQPRFRILLPDIRDRELTLTKTRLLGKVSRRDVKLMSAMVGHDWRKAGYQRDTVRVQGLYNLEALANEASIEGLPSRKQTYIRRNLRELRIRSAGSFETDKAWMIDANRVVNAWRTGPAGVKQRQLAITRDFVAITLAHKWMPKTSFLFYRGDIPVGVIVYDPIGRNAVGDLVCKGLNYPQIPGGYHNTALTMVIMASRYLLNQGYRYLNDGGLDGGTSGLYEYKQQIVSMIPGSTTMRTTDWVLPDTTYYPEFL